MGLESRFNQFIESGAFEIVRCGEKYWEFVRVLRNCSKKGFIEQSQIGFKQHRVFMSKHSNNYRIGLYQDKPIGFVGLVNNDIRIAVSQLYLRRGFGGAMLEKFIEEYPNGIVKIKLDNFASISLFESLGYVKKLYIMEKKQNDAP